ncbi:MAG: sulfotransferase family protein [Comamonas sp.]
MDTLNLRGWRPVRMYWDNAQVMVDWARLADAPHLAPFYQESVGAELRKPFHNAFRRQTPLADMLAWQVQSPGIAPCLLTFHVSRCGSTLIPQAFAQSAHHLALSEPAPMDFLAREARVNGWLTEQEAIAALRAWLSAWAQRSDPSSPALNAVSIKLDAWNTNKAELFARAWPQAQYLFLTREPLAVLVSQMQERGFFLVPGAMGPYFGLPGKTALEMATMPPAEYCARMLGHIYADMAHVADPERSLVLDYTQLPHAIEEQLIPRLAWEPSATELQAMRSRLARHGKRPEQDFSADTSAKHASANKEWRMLAEQWMEPHYNALLEQCTQVATDNITEAVT